MENLVLGRPFTVWYRIRTVVCPVLSVCHWCMWPNCWMDQDATWYGRRPRPRRHCASVRWGPSFPYPMERAI